MSDGGAIALALAAFAGALAAVAVPWWLGVSVAVAAVLRRSPLLLAVAMALIVSTLAAHRWDDLLASVPDRLDGSGTVATDPERDEVGATAVISVDGRRYLASAYGPAAGRLERAQVGDRVEVRGRIRPWLAGRERHAALRTAHRLSIDDIVVTPTRSPLWILAGTLRSTIADGAGVLDDERRALFTGLVYGDDRGQADLVAADFRLAGLTHLLAVSGQNVAYVLALSRPLIRTLGRRGRWAATGGVLLVFAAATRFEPSVLRATAMAAIAATGDLLGREAAPLRILALAVAGLLLVDPLLAETIAFRLSVAASAGIVILRPRLTARLGEGPMREALAVTLSAQLAVAPLLLTAFGPVSPVSIPANLLAGPVAGLVMIWGMTGGVVAGLVGGEVADLAHRVVTTPALTWLETVARTAAMVPVAPVGARWVAAAVAIVLTWRRARPWMRTIALAALAAAMVPVATQGLTAVGPGGMLHVVGDVHVLELAGRSDPVRLLDDLAAARVRTLDVVVADRRDRDDLLALARRVAIDRLVVRDETTLGRIEVEGVAVEVGATGVQVGSAGPMGPDG